MYLREQIDSILSQNGVDVVLKIRDDCSSDNTQSILENYAIYENINITFGESLGVGKSFMSILYENPADSDYYAFADQDDIWDPDKLLSGIKIMEKLDKEPYLYVCNQRCVDKEGKFICNRFPEDFPVQKLHNLLFINLYAGCTMIFNQPLFELLTDINRRPNIDFFDHRIHDAWVSCVASINDAIIFDSDCHMSFRRHRNNETDAEITRGVKTSIKTRRLLLRRKINRFFKKNRRRHSVEYTAIHLLNGYSDIISAKDKDMLLMVSSYRESLIHKLKLLNSKWLRDAAPEKKMDLILKALLNDL